jgi:hypothetical protein
MVGNVVLRGSSQDEDGMTCPATFQDIRSVPMRAERAEIVYLWRFHPVPFCRIFVRNRNGEKNFVFGAITIRNGVSLDEL